MNPKIVWFLAGTGAGVAATVRARRLAYRLTPSGVSDQLAAVGLGARAFADEVRAGMQAREAELAHELGVPLPQVDAVAQHRAVLESRAAPAAPPPPD